jgi:hypothetical protein
MGQGQDEQDGDQGEAPGPPWGYDFFAVVNTNGTLARGTPGTAVTHPRAGRYNVRFPASVAGCAAVGNLGYPRTVEIFTFPAVVTAMATNGRTVLVDVTFPGNVAGGYPNRPVLRDNSFHLHVDCRHALFANVAANGILTSASPGVTAAAHVAGSGGYVLNFGRDISKCAPVGTVQTNSGRTAQAVQTYIALRTGGQSLQVSVNDSTTKAVDKPFGLIVTCGEQPVAVYSVSDGFYNATPIPQAVLCAITANWYNSTPGGAPSNQGYVSTWTTTTNTAVVQTKNGGYGVQPGNGIDLVASC